MAVSRYEDKRKFARSQAAHARLEKKYRAIPGKKATEKWIYHNSVRTRQELRDFVLTRGQREVLYAAAQKQAAFDR